jgi:hypothetical protein
VVLVSLLKKGASDREQNLEEKYSTEEPNEVMGEKAPDLLALL